MDEAALQLVSEIGTQLGQQSRPIKGFIVKSLRQAASALSQLEQPNFPDATKKLEAAKKLEAGIKPLKRSIIHGLLQHKDKDVQLLVAICVSEMFRVLAPEPPFEDEYLRDIFKLILNTFAELADTTSPFFSRRVKIIETVSRCKCCVIMLDIDCNDLVMEMFNIFFSVVREHHQKSLISDILSIMSHILHEEASEQLLDVILRNLLKEDKASVGGTPSASSKLAISLIQTCSENLGPFICGFLTSCILDRDAVVSELKEFYHEIIFRIFQCAPEMLLAVIPNVTQELLTDQVDVRIKAVNLIGKFFSLPEHRIAQKYHDLFIEFLKRFSDKSAEVRVSALQCAKICYMANPSGPESEDVLTALEGRLLDFDDRVRMQAVIVACDLARSNLKIFPPKLIFQAMERLRDKKIPVRKKALQKLMELYCDYCNKCSEGLMGISDNLEKIPCKILMLCYDKDCKEFRSQNMELVLAEDLFPPSLSVSERTRHWIHLFSLFTPHQLKSLNSILSQKRRLQNEMQTYLALKKKEKENCLEEMQNRYRTSFMKMAACFTDPSKAEECFLKLNHMKDNNIFNTLAHLLDELHYTNSQTIRAKFLNMIGNKHQNLEFLRTLSLKCSHNIFSSEHVSCILDHLSSNRNKNFEASSVRFLQTVTSLFPMLLKGSEKQFQNLLEESNTVDDKLIEVLAIAGPHISVKLSEIYPFLERLCLEGTRMQSKFAVSAIAALTDSSKQLVFSNLCKGLVESLHIGRNVPTVLQSLGCLAQYSVSAFETQNGEITQLIHEKIFQMDLSDGQSSFDDTYGCTNSCKLKIYGLKTLVKSFLPHQGTKVQRKINELLDLLSLMLQKGDTCDGVISENSFSESEKACIRLAAAKSVLQLSRRWDLHFSPEIFRFTISMAKDESSSVRRSFLDKTYKLLKEHAIPSRYACAYALATSDSLKDLKEDSFKYMAEFVREYGREARIRQTSEVQQGLIIDFPACIVIFLIHLLAHDRDYPSEDCQDEITYAKFCSPLFFVLQALLNASNVNGDMEVVKEAVLYLLCIFRAIKKAEDAVDADKTPKLHMLSDIGFSFVAAVNRSSISSSHAPGQILLPSSLYRIGPANKNDEANSRCLIIKSCLDEFFVRRVIHIFKSQISMPDSILPKHGRTYQEDRTQSDILKENLLNFPSCKVVDLTIAGTTENQKAAKQDLSIRNRRKLSASGAPESVGLHGCSILHDGASKKSKPCLEKEQLSSSCGSVPIKPCLTELHGPSQNMEANSVSLKESVGVNRRTLAENSKYSNAKYKDSCSSKDTINKGEALIGQRIRLSSPVDRCFYSGTVDGYSSLNNTHKIICDSGDVDVVCLDSESWEMISDGSLVERVVSAEDSDTFVMQQCDMGKHSSFSDPEIPLDTFGEVAAKRQKILAGVEKKKKRQKASTETFMSEVVDVNKDAVLRRSRRQKVKT
ncbi:sister chromatid cohesion protein PDS5 homolog B isoform X1 [Ziziphus jujuba]|uniref:Sister chromatid cohesion protein PDS5 homolog B isoform X1 n=2 Tax=Ziziphus jujuba TaxID=326968 RepID=A0ABM3INL2_ZIZJJ|nr:sister chromatid cohesion protein PDS5 homolog B isoform X1 [Ziziphus jujuba]